MYNTPIVSANSSTNNKLNFQHKGNTMNNLQDILLFPVRDAEARKQFLLACLITLAGFIVPLVPMFFLVGYSAKIMRQIIEERTSPSMPDWQSSDWTEMFMDGLRVYGAQFLFMLPFMLVLGISVVAMASGIIATSAPINDSGQTLLPIGLPFMFVGMGLMIIFSVLTIPYSVIVSTVGPHVAVTRSFESAFHFKTWWNIFRSAIGQFVLAYIFAMAVSWVLMIVMQFAIMTIILICVVPIIMIPYTAYIALTSNALYAQAYATGLDNLKAE